MTSKIVSKWVPGSMAECQCYPGTHTYISLAASPLANRQGSTSCTKLLSGIISMQNHTCCTFMVNLEDFRENFNYIQLLFLTSESSLYKRCICPLQYISFWNKLLKVQQGTNLGQRLGIIDAISTWNAQDHVWLQKDEPCRSKHRPSCTNPSSLPSLTFHGSRTLTNLKLSCIYTSHRFN